MLGFVLCGHCYTGQCEPRIACILAGVRVHAGRTLSDEGTPLVRFVLSGALRGALAACITQRRAQAGAEGELHPIVVTHSHMREQGVRRGNTDRGNSGQRHRDERGKRKMVQLGPRAHQPHNHRRLHGSVRRRDSGPPMRQRVDHRCLRSGSNQISLMKRSCRSTPNWITTSMSRYRRFLMSLRANCRPPGFCFTSRTSCSKASSALVA